MDVENPPSYNNATGETDQPPLYEEHLSSPDDMPPSYDSIFGQMRRAKETSSGALTFFKALLVIIVGTIGCTICVGLVLCIPVSMIVIGTIYLDDCPAERFIPIYLIVGGVFGVIKNLSSVVQRAKNNNDSTSTYEDRKSNSFDGLLGVFLLIWFIAGNIWIYRIYDKYNDDPDDEMFCDPKVYWFAFWTTTSVYILIGITIFCTCCAGCIGCLFY